MSTDNDEFEFLSNLADDILENTEEGNALVDDLTNAIIISSNQEEGE